MLAFAALVFTKGNYSWADAGTRGICLPAFEALATIQSRQAEMARLSFFSSFFSELFSVGFQRWNSFILDFPVDRVNGVFGRSIESFNGMKMLLLGK